MDGGPRRSQRKDSLENPGVKQRILPTPVRHRKGVELFMQLIDNLNESKNQVSPRLLEIDDWIVH